MSFLFLLDVWNADQPVLEGKQSQGNNESGKESKDESAISRKKTPAFSQEQHNDAEGKFIPAKHTLANVGVEKLGHLIIVRVRCLIQGKASLSDLSSRT